MVDFLPGATVVSLTVRLTPLAFWKVVMIVFDTGVKPADGVGFEGFAAGLVDFFCAMIAPLYFF